MDIDRCIDKLNDLDEVIAYRLREIEELEKIKESCNTNGKLEALKNVMTII
jgi:hypothetical protein